MYLISLYFDESSNKILNRHIQQIARFSGNSFMVKNNVPPHLTVSAVEARSAKSLVHCISSLDGKLPSGEINVVSFGFFLPYVIYAAPVMNTYLRQISEDIYNVIPQNDEITVNRLYIPDNWFAHITLGKTLSKDQLNEAFSYMRESFAPFKARIVSLGFSRVNPHEDILTLNLC